MAWSAFLTISFLLSLFLDPFLLLLLVGFLPPVRACSARSSSAALHRTLSEKNETEKEKEKVVFFLRAHEATFSILHFHFSTLSWSSLPRLARDPSCRAQARLSYPAVTAGCHSLFHPDHRRQNATLPPRLGH